MNEEKLKSMHNKLLDILKTDEMDIGFNALENILIIGAMTTTITKKEFLFELFCKWDDIEKAIKEMDV